MKSLLITIIAISMGCARAANYQDFKATLNEYSEAQTRLAASLEKVSDAAGLAKALDEIADVTEHFNVGVEAAALKYPELSSPKPPLEATQILTQLVKRAEEFQDNRTALQNAVKRYDTSPKVLKAWNRLQTAIKH